MLHLVSTRKMRAWLRAGDHSSFAGDDGARSVNDVWTFARDLSAADPNWTLVATSGELP